MALTTINTEGIKNDTIKNEDVKSDAAIAGSKVAPNFGSQNIVTTGAVGIGIASPDRSLHVSHNGSDGTQLQLTGTLDSAGIKCVPASGDVFEYQAAATGCYVAYNRTDSRADIFVDGTGNVGIGDTDPTKTLTVGTATPVILLDDQSSRTLEIYGPSSTKNAAIGTASNHNLYFFTNGYANDHLLLDTSGRILKGITTARGNYANNTSGVEYEVQIEGTSAITSSISLIRSSNDADDGGIVIGKTRSATTGGNTVVQADDHLGTITFAGADGTTLQFGAEITAEVQSGVGNDDMPTDLIFKTNGGSTDVDKERLRISSDGDVYIGGHSAPVQTYSNADILSIYDTATSSGGIELAGASNSNGYSAGQLMFVNNNNANQTAWQTDSKMVGMLRAEIVTGDSNAGDDSGANMVIYAKPDSGASANKFYFKGNGDFSIDDGDLIVADGHGIRANGPNNSTYGELKIQVDVPDSSGSNNEATFKKASQGIVLAFPSGGGIDFSARGHATGMSSELFNNYEEGTWTPVVGGVTTNPSGGDTGWTVQVGRYTIVGRLVYISFYLQHGSKDLSDGQGNLVITGLPVNASGSTTAGYPRVNIGYSDNAGNYHSDGSGASHLGGAGWQVNNANTDTLLQYTSTRTEWGSGAASWELSGNGILEMA